MAASRYPVRRSPRLVGFDYRLGGAYFLTVCTATRRELFGRIAGDRMRLNWRGQIVAEELVRVPALRESVALDAFVVMPNHLHAIVVLTSDAQVRLGAVVNQFKAAVTRRACAVRGEVFAMWQRGYYEHIIRDDRDLAAIREYIAANPQQWAEDRER